jgi:hypothetical protein
MNTESGITISCARCGKASDFGRWVERPVSGPLPPGQFQCPECGAAFRKVATGGWKFIRDERGRIVDGFRERAELQPVAGQL